jgi:hypothetical protein
VIQITIELEGRAVARLICATHEEQDRLSFDLWERNVLLQVAVALEQLRQALPQEAA